MIDQIIDLSTSLGVIKQNVGLVAAGTYFTVYGCDLQSLNVPKSNHTLIFL